MKVAANLRQIQVNLIYLLSYRNSVNFAFHESPRDKLATFIAILIANFLPEFHAEIILSSKQHDHKFCISVMSCFRSRLHEEMKKMKWNEAKLEKMKRISI